MTHADPHVHDDLHEDHGTPIRRRDRGKMPVARESKARAASKATWRSKRASRRFGKMTNGIRNRRLKRPQ